MDYTVCDAYTGRDNEFHPTGDQIRSVNYNLLKKLSSDGRLSDWHSREKASLTPFPNPMPWIYCCTTARKRTIDTCNGLQCGKKT